MKKDNSVYIQHILNAITLIQEYIEGFSYDQFRKDSKTFDAVIRQFSIIGEAARNCHSLHKQFPQIPWREMIAMRNYLVHDYCGVDIREIWQTCEHDLIPLKNNLQQILPEIVIGEPEKMNLPPDTQQKVNTLADLMHTETRKKL